MAKTISIRVQRELRAKLGTLAKNSGLTLSQFVRERLTRAAGLPAKSAAAPKKQEGAQ